MRILISTEKDIIDSNISELFARSPCFIIAENGKVVETIKNTNINMAGSAGVAAAKLVAEKKADAIITANLGPRALEVLEQFKIKIYYKKGNALKALSEVEKKDGKSK